MVCTANELLEWKDFPKGLKVLLLDQDGTSATEMKSKLEKMEYVVSTFCNKNEALSAILDRTEKFHVAIVEVKDGDNDGIFEFLETAKDLPTIMTSNFHCLSTMMKCIALGAVEFLQKPLSDDKLRNIWQHVVHKAFNAGGKDASESLKPVKESIVSLLELQSRKKETDVTVSVKTEHLSAVQENTQEVSSGCDKYPAPSTPQLKQGLRSVDDGDCQDQTNFSAEQESVEQDGESKSVEITYGNLVPETAASQPSQLVETLIKEERESNDACHSQTNTSEHSLTKDSTNNFDTIATPTNKASGLPNPSGTKANRKKMKVDWTPELHKKFVQAVEQLGVDQAIPSRILELMKVEGLTRHNVASHLQKYRMNRRHILPKEDDRRWPHPRDSTNRSYNMHRPIMAYPPYHMNHSIPGGQSYPAWLPHGGYTTGVQTWGSPYYPGWQPPERWHWKPYPTTHADAWGCPMMQTPYSSHTPFSNNVAGLHNADGMHNRGKPLQNTFDPQLAEEVVDKVVKEAISKPWLPLPLGLKPPSTESVLSELSRQGISAIPPHISGSHHIH